MATYRELYFKGTEQQLKEFASQILEYAVGDWTIDTEKEIFVYPFKTHVFKYNGDLVRKAYVHIPIGDKNFQKGELKVGTIAAEGERITVDEHNAVLIQFYNDVIMPYKISGSTLNIQLTD